MSNFSLFSEVLEAAEHLGANAQRELVAVLTRRLAERSRERVSATVCETRREFAAGQCQVVNATDLIREAQS